MYTHFPFDIEKAISSIKLVLSNLMGESDFHKLFKILYFSEQKHLAQYGRPIIGDRYIAMKHGPVPSNIYDILKALRGDSIFKAALPDLSADFSIENNFYVKMKNSSFDIELFSDSELECIIEAINENKFLDFPTITKKSHDKAWESAERDDEMSLFEIARVGGANDELLNYISLNLENQHLTF